MQMPKNETKNGGIKDFVPSRVYPPTLRNTWDTFFGKYNHDHCTHPTITYLGILATKLGLFNLIPKNIQKFKLEK